MHRGLVVFHLQSIRQIFDQPEGYPETDEWVAQLEQQVQMLTQEIQRGAARIKQKQHADLRRLADDVNHVKPPPSIDDYVIAPLGICLDVSRMILQYSMFDQVQYEASQRFISTPHGPLVVKSHGRRALLGNAPVHGWKEHVSTLWNLRFIAGFIYRKMEIMGTGGSHVDLRCTIGSSTFRFFKTLDHWHVIPYQNGQYPFLTCVPGQLYRSGWARVKAGYIICWNPRTNVVSGRYGVPLDEEEYIVLLPMNLKAMVDLMPVFKSFAAEDSQGMFACVLKNSLVDEGVRLLFTPFIVNGHYSVPSYLLPPGQDLLGAYQVGSDQILLSTRVQGSSTLQILRMRGRLPKPRDLLGMDSTNPCVREDIQEVRNFEFRVIFSGPNMLPLGSEVTSGFHWDTQEMVFMCEHSDAPRLTVVKISISALVM